MFDTVLVANRGEIAVRIIRTLRAQGIRSVSVYSDADAGAAHVRQADVAVRLGPAAAAESYLSVERILAAAAKTEADAVHPGYGFLAENAAFARACADAGLVFIGPPPSAIEAMGDKIRAKQTVEAAGVPVVPGQHRPGLTDDDLAAAADRIGFPVLLKPSAGGGGKGMRRVSDPMAIRDEIASARREARGAFGDDTLLIERYVDAPRHIEIQVLADSHGNVVHLGERECSLQRRHQKVIEEAPSPMVDEMRRSAMGAAAVEAARAAGYVGAGTVEFIVSGDRPDEFFFMEMNTRLQVEHPVTEMVTGLDLVEWQLRIAGGERLGFGQDDVRLRGHAIEARVYAEDPARGFLPTGGEIRRLQWPSSADVRVDSGVVEGDVVSSDYDPMLAKVIAWGEDRRSALRRLDSALADTTLLGVTTNIGFLRALLGDADVVAGNLDTGLVERRLEELVATSVAKEDVLVAAVLARRLAEESVTGVVDRFAVPDGWRVGGPAWTSRNLLVSGQPHAVRLRGHAHDAEVVVGSAQPVRARVERHDDDLLVTIEGVTTRFACVRLGRDTWLARDGQVWLVHEPDPADVSGAGTAGGAGGAVRAPMPGTVTLVKVAAGEPVIAGQPLVVLEAMKMEHVLSAPFDGRVTDLRAAPGRTVRLDEVVAVVEPEAAQSAAEPAVDDVEGAEPQVVTE